MANDYHDWNSDRWSLDFTEDGMEKMLPISSQNFLR